MAHAELNVEDKTRIDISTEYRENDLVKMIPGCRWDPGVRLWHVPLSWTACKILRGVFGDRLVVGPELADWAWEIVTTYINPQLELRNAVEWDEPPALDGLLSFQNPGSRFLAHGSRAILADEMGTGKTVQSIAATKLVDEDTDSAFPCLVITPNSVKKPWLNEFRKWWPDVTVEVVTGSADKRRKQIASGADVIVINWESVRLHSRLAPYGSIRLEEKEKVPGDLNRVPFKTVIADEAHKMKNPKAKQTRAVWAVGHQPSVQHRYALTGTPVANSPEDLWAILHFIDPQEWPSKTKFVDRYCLISFNAWGGMDVIGIRPEMRDEFFAILDPHFRRMPKELVLPFLPPKLRTRREAEMGKAQAKAYQQIDENMMTTLDDGSQVYTTNTLARNTRLCQFSSSYAVVNEDGDVRLSEPSNKLDELMNILEDLGDEESVVVAAESRQLIELAAARLDEAAKAAIKGKRNPRPFSYQMIVGGLTTDQRDAAIQTFQSGGCRIMLFTIKAGGIGITLTRAGHLVFLQRSWSLIDNKQAEDRVHRIGSEIHDKINIIDVVAPGTVEETQIDRLYTKLERLQEIVRDKEVLAAAAAAGDQAARDRLAALEQEEDKIMTSDLTKEN